MQYAITIIYLFINSNQVIGITLQQSHHYHNQDVLVMFLSFYVQRAIFKQITQ